MPLHLGILAVKGFKEKAQAVESVIASLKAQIADEVSRFA